jgi:ADP-heptose:LPS heptosyltransferase
MKILIIKRDKIGDLLLTTPMLAHLRQSLPGAEVHLLANDYNAWVVADNADVDRTWIYRRVRIGNRVSVAAAFGILWQNVQLRRQRYDVAIVANGSPSPRAIERGTSSGARRVIAYVDKPGEDRGVTDGLVAPGHLHETELLLGLLAPLGIAPPVAPIFPRYALPPARQAFAVRWLAAEGLRPGGYIVLGLGARRAKKQPTRGQILAWSAHWKNTWDLDTVFMWTPGKSDNPLYPGDDDVAQPVLDAGVPYIHPFRGALAPALGLIWNAKTSMFPDSGLMHFAAASPGGVLGLFAETEVSPHPDQWGPRGARVAYLEAQHSVAELDDAAVISALAKLAGKAPA